MTRTQIAWDGPKFMIDCVLANVSTQLEADGCVLELGCEEEGHTLTTPDHLRVGDTVNVQLWLEGEEAFIDIRLADSHKDSQALDLGGSDPGELR